MESFTAGDELRWGLDLTALGMTRPEDSVGAEWFRYFSGSALNLSAQWAQQKKKFLPACRCEYFAVAGFTLIPQTGSRCGSVAVVRGLVDMNLESVTRLARPACALWLSVLYIRFTPGAFGELQTDHYRYDLYQQRISKLMTYLDVAFSYGAVPGENELRAIDGMREVYGIRGVEFNEKNRTVRVGFDASRLKTDAVVRLLRQAGIDVKENLMLT
jgi:hypothetical protein